MLRLELIVGAELVAVDELEMIEDLGLETVEFVATWEVAILEAIELAVIWLELCAKAELVVTELVAIWELLLLEIEITELELDGAASTVRLAMLSNHSYVVAQFSAKTPPRSL
jgi:hypothetical protein